MIKRLYDAHAHLSDDPHENLRTSDRAALDSLDRIYSVINGISPDDWSAVLNFTQRAPGILPAIGLHPQSVTAAPENWKETFLQLLPESTTCFIGEIGLDRRYQNDRFGGQLDAFSWQLEQASMRNLPVSIHCVQAIGLLMETLRSHNLPKRGIHLHAYAGPVELIPELLEMGTYFSFASRQLKFNSVKVRDQIRAIPINQLLIETDETFKTDCLRLLNCYTLIAETRGISIEKLATHIEENFKRYFLAG